MVSSSHPTASHLKEAKMLPFHVPAEYMDQSFTEQLELNRHLLPNSSHFPSTLSTILCPDNFHDYLLFASDGVTNAAPGPASTRPSLPLGDAAPPTARNTESSGRQRGAWRKDRHSKIITANGPRDRRMRLSIDVAGKFFQLQDMLGFDRASKTVQWLLTMSKAAIRELTIISQSRICAAPTNQSPKTSESSTLVCDDSSILSGTKNKSSAATAMAATKVKKIKSKRGGIKPPKKADFHTALARESRAKARERARERTREKQMMTSLSSTNIPLDAVKEDPSLHNLESLLEFANKEEGRSCASNPRFNIASDRAYEYPMMGGSVLIPVLENAQAPTAINDTSSILDEQWDIEALCLYSRSVASFNNYHNV